MKSTTKAWIIASPRKWYFFFVAIVLLLAIVFNKSHFLDAFTGSEELSWRPIAYFWIVIWAMLFDGTNASSRVILPFFAFVFLKAGALFCFYYDCSIPVLLYVVLALDVVVTVWTVIVGVKLGRWTFNNMDEVISRREKWRKSKVDIYSYARRYSIARGIAVTGCLYNAFVVFIFLVVIR